MITRITIVLACVLMGMGCVHKQGSTTPNTPLEQQARNVSAALEGAIVAAQAEWTPSCKTDPKQSQCDAITRAVSGENALITSIESYCDWNPANPPTDPTTKCTPVSSAQAGLTTAVANAQTFLNELKGVLQK